MLLYKEEEEGGGGGGGEGQFGALHIGHSLM